MAGIVPAWNAGGAPIGGLRIVPSAFRYPERDAAAGAAPASKAGGAHPGLGIVPSALRMDGDAGGSGRRLLRGWRSLGRVVRVHRHPLEREAAVGAAPGLNPGGASRPGDRAPRVPRPSVRCPTRSRS